MPALNLGSRRCPQHPYTPLPANAAQCMVCDGVKLGEIDRTQPKQKTKSGRKRTKKRLPDLVE